MNGIVTMGGMKVFASIDRHWASFIKCLKKLCILVDLWICLFLDILKIVNCLTLIVANFVIVVKLCVVDMVWRSFDKRHIIL
jgi:hypothetical protein